MLHPSLFCLSNYTPNPLNSVLAVTLSEVVVGGMRGADKEPRGQEKQMGIRYCSSGK